VNSIAAVSGGQRFVGQSVHRKEDPRLVSGHGTYVDDVTLPNLLHVSFLRSDVARARITRLDVSAARQAKGVHAVFTAADLAPAIKGTLAATMFLDSPMATLRVLADGDVRFAGEAIAMVVADNRYLAEDACELIEVDYDVLTPVIDFERAAADTTNLVHPERGTNVMAGGGVDHPELDAVFASAAHVFTETFRQHRQSQVPMEPHGIIVRWDQYDREFRVWSSCQRVHEVRATLCRVLGVGEHSIHVTQRDVGGGFGQKGAMRTEQIAVAVGAYLMGAALKWIEDRRENLVSGGHARSDRVTVTMALDDDGTILGVRLDHLEESGAYPVGGNIGGMIAMMFSGPYRMQRLGWSSASVFTNTCGRNAYRGPWNLETVAREQMMDLAARRLGIDPIELRRRNLIHVEDLPFKNAGGMTYVGVDPESCLDQALTMLDYESFRREQAEARSQGRMLGVGVSLFIEPTALGVGTLIGTEAAHVKITLNGQVTVALGTGGHGQSIATTMAQIAADELGVDFADVSVIEGDTDISPIGGGTGGSRSGVIGGAAVHQSASQVRDKVVAIAAHMLEAAPNDLEIAQGRVSVRGTPSRGVTFGEIAKLAYVSTAKLPPDTDAGLEALTRYSTPSITWANACHICTVEITDTSEIKLLRYIVSEDCGVMINPMVVEGQISGGVVQGIGAVLHEGFVYDDAGNPLTTTFLDYLIPTSTEIPVLEIGHMETPASGPGGYKGVGEGGAIGAVPAVRNAISDALAQAGAPGITTPVRPCDVHDLLRSAAAAPG
jgi:carbon-monoxide dehydrogenase large subunit